MSFGRTQTFKKVISNKDKTVLVDFYADWCQPCKVLAPVLEKVVTDPETKTSTGTPLDLVTVNIDEEADLAAEYDVRALPTVMAFRDGKPVGKFAGSYPEPQVRHFVQTF
ncbi:thioredoxin-like protein [Fomitopsis betulina]|nr:thioredoxin-like protein [Fomitopsis betulina]